MEQVIVKVKENGKVIKTVSLSRIVAESAAKRQPDLYEIVAPPKIEVLKLEPIVEPQKKSVEVAANVPKNEVKEPEQKSKGGRPKKSL